MLTVVRHYILDSLIDTHSPDGSAISQTNVDDMGTANTVIVNVTN